ncbi:MAG: glycine oxidase ThiO [Planctomycetes bacterium]|nr:glycine oxidase ThiO [Planctomycetota bacterium]MBI3833622.1 glycine oxidase ThiO [Planctomycetota bacterium]
MSTHPDVIVIGGGVIGLSIARRLSLDGLAVALLERGVCGAEASWAGAGVLTPSNPHRRDAIAELRQKSLALYPQFCNALREESGIDPEYEECGELEIALNDSSLRSLKSDADAGQDALAPDGRPAYQFHDPVAAQHIEPLIAPNILGAMECRLTSQVRNPRLLQTLKAACLQKGVNIYEHTEVAGLLRHGMRVIGVQTHSDKIHAAQTVICAGAWSAQLDDQSRDALPVYPVRGQIILMRFDRRPFTHVIARGKTYLVPRRDGHVLLGATEEHDSGFNKRTTASGIASLLEKGMKLVPSIRDAAIVATWAGLRPGTPDENPLIGPIPESPGLFAATGHFRSGLILAPITAEIISAQICNRQTPLADEAFGVERVKPVIKES